MCMHACYVYVYANRLVNAQACICVCMYRLTGLRWWAFVGADENKKQTYMHVYGSPCHTTDVYMYRQMCMCVSACTGQSVCSLYVYGVRYETVYV
ncbi:hypothetical protein EON63_17905 [archaeon]|nr:MAG: hypothetical protein EON63_17905 [archaeon]